MSRPSYLSPSSSRIYQEALRRYYEQLSIDLSTTCALEQSGLLDPRDPKSVLQDRIAELHQNRKDHGRLHHALDSMLDVLLVFNDAFGELGDSANIPGGKALFVAFGVLLKATRNLRNRERELEKLLGKASDFLERYAVRERLKTEETNEGLFVDIFVNVLKVLGLATQILHGRRQTFRNLLAALRDNQDIHDAETELNACLDAELQWTSVEVLRTVVQGSIVVS
ncbi:hypothetical protein CYLTODRAFT_267102 [Cylindrobasidium torrendii FP15055 ss-10]|uniref:Fungal STAND N-terminal Goodbye domain-containing protein n=1 Tax=Cylindrobasidium torrendii FP15055 ss-10 TaxID=1314674 RepID=A0A0D7BCE3_9AGAR|nr:hypothetical protein CYLTODRAFT_267102 [Cylindrobasidium torrendii FP15055 ss-10]